MCENSGNSLLPKGTETDIWMYVIRAKQIPGMRSP
jgi:hypothetical protein